MIESMLINKSEEINKLQFLSMLSAQSTYGPCDIVTFSQEIMELLYYPLPQVYF